ncbi:C40 family peptidase [Pareuzebyella sediminis]|uniref:C40 family peptidase n=1 Tax=Pareuzebyella sediminis TaxID=2607998 RepID=UPI0011ED6D73|nr:C40 family peptidase [Pareuzebyella sediminis]
MRKTFIVIWLLSLVGCGVSKKKASQDRTRKVSVAATRPPTETKKRASYEDSPATKHSKADHVINTALKFSGVRYRYGGTTKKGMDCSGLLYVAFGENDIQLPRTSYHMAEEGKRVRINEVVKGDLLFFRTRKGSKRINHVGMVVDVDDDEIKFIHASTSRGVIVSSLREGYWSRAFVRATRVLL